nr:lytic polysaccharide monooxygenase [Micromonospora sp. DSM 115978]
MTTGRRLASLAVVVLVGALAGPALAAGPVRAHGAAADPVSRAAACGPGGGRAAGSAACRAAAEIGLVRDEWDNVRVPGVAGRDRAVIPDGRLCSGGHDEQRGLDLARADWPATRLTPGTRYTFGYRTTIPHKGQFRMYVTVDGYNPTKPLTWADLETEPFLSVTDPPLRDGAYRIAGTLPAGRSGRHLIYTVWQNSTTPDTYYSCSDVDFGADPAASPSPAATAPGPAASGSVSAAPGALAGPIPTMTAADTAAAGDGTAAAESTWSAAAADAAPVTIGAAVVALGLLTLVGVRRFRRGRRAGTVDSPPRHRG